MYSILLKKALPFTLTFVFGAALGGFGALFGAAEKGAGALSFKREYGRRACRARGQKLVAETKPLVVLFKPDALLPRPLGRADDGPGSARALVTFGADGKVQAVEPLDERSVAAWREWPATGKEPAPSTAWAAVERAARQIKFLPETINGMPVSVTKEVEIRFVAD